MSGTARIASVLIIALLPASITAQSWMKLNYNDPMNDKTYQGYGLYGTFLDEQTPVGQSPTLEVVCQNGKLKKVAISSDTYLYRVDGIGGPFAPGEFTNLRIRIDQRKVPIWQHPATLNADHKIAQLHSGDARDILHAHNVIVQFSDASGATHYAQFTIPPIDIDLQKSCGLK